MQLDVEVSPPANPNRVATCDVQLARVKCTLMSGPKTDRQTEID